EIVSRYPEVTNIVEAIGADDAGEVRNATLYISLVPPSERELSQQEWERKVIQELRRIPDGRIFFAKQQGGGGGRDITLYLAGDDPALVDKTARQVVAEMETVPV